MVSDLLGCFLAPRQGIPRPTTGRFPSCRLGSRVLAPYHSFPRANKRDNFSNRRKPPLTSKKSPCPTRENSVPIHYVCITQTTASPVSVSNQLTPWWRSRKRKTEEGSAYFHKVSNALRAEILHCERKLVLSSSRSGEIYTRACSCNRQGAWCALV